jgi:hypothetical protein
MPRLVEAVRRVDETNDAVLHEVPNNRIRHRRRHSAGQPGQREDRRESALLTVAMG